MAGASFHIGDTYTPAPAREFLGLSCPPMWFAFRTPPQCEVKARAWLEFRSVEAWFPTEEAFRLNPRGNRKKIPYTRRPAPGYVFARFERFPQWDMIKASRYIVGPIAHDNRPIAITDREMAQMEQVPAMLEGLRRKAAFDAEIHPGDWVRITEGTMIDWAVEITEVGPAHLSFLKPFAAKINAAHVMKIPSIVCKSRQHGGREAGA